MLSDNDDETDLDPEVAKELQGAQADYAAQMKEKLRRKRNGEVLSADEDIDEPTPEEMKDLMEQSRKLAKQQRAAKRQAKLEEEANCENCTETNTSNITSLSPE
jgi:non-homologous end joining protein Ku